MVVAKTTKKRSLSIDSNIWLTQFLEVHGVHSLGLLKADLMIKRLNWNTYQLNKLNDALSESYCLYVLHSSKDGDRPHYIGKAKFFGTAQKDGYKSSARYNSGYTHLLAGMLRSGYTLYIANLGANFYEKAESYEQELIHEWNPIRKQMRKPKIRRKVDLAKPWL